MTDTLYREFTLRSPSDGAAMVSFVKANAKACADRGSPLRVIVTEDEIDRMDVQLRYYWGPMLQAVAENGWVEGRRFDKETWHVHFAKLFLPSKEITLPDGTIEIQRGSIARGKIGMKAMAKYTQEVEAYCASELGVVFEDRGF